MSQQQNDDSLWNDSGEDELDVRFNPNEESQKQRPIIHRLTVNERVYHQISGEQPSMFQSVYSRQLQTDEQVYERHINVDETPQRLDTGWIEHVGLLLIHNTGGKQNQHRKLSDAEQALESRRILSVYYSDCIHHAWLVPPKESMRGLPAELNGLMLKSQSGVIRVLVQIIPA